MPPRTRLGICKRFYAREKCFESHRHSRLRCHEIGQQMQLGWASSLGEKLRTPYRKRLIDPWVHSARKLTRTDGRPDNARRKAGEAATRPADDWRTLSCCARAAITNSRSTQLLSSATYWPI